jgi:hypothetical protein
MMKRCLTVTLGLGLLTVAQHVAAEEPWTPGLAELHRIDRLACVRPSIRIGSVSSYDRSGGNDDGFSGKYSFVAREDDGLVIADLEGPGVIYRIWTPTPTDDWVEFYFDGEKRPRIRVKFRDLFMGNTSPFAAPLVGYGAGGFYRYVPLPYRKSCKVLVRAERVQFYQINYAQYPTDIPINTWQADASDANRHHQQKAVSLFAASGSDISDWGAPANSETVTYQASLSLNPGASATLFETNDPGRIVGLRIKPAAALAGKDRDVLLRMRWDDATQPAVSCPAGDFFGYAWGQPAMKSLLLGTAGDVNYCYFPMPFDESAKIELVSERTDGAPVEIQSEVVYAPVARSKDEGKFCALWRRENPTRAGIPFTFVETQGKGHLVGCILQAQGPESGQTLFFEGDDQTTIDGETCIHGTGSEDFFNGGWYDVPGRWEKRLSFPLSGCLGYQKHLGRTGGYRFMLGDAYAFRESICQTIEHAPTGNEMPTDYCGVTFLYLLGSAKLETSLPDREARRVVDFERIIFTPSWAVPIHAFTFRGATLSKREEEIRGQRVSFLRMQADQPQDWFGPPFLSLVCDMPAAGRYEVSIEAVKGPGQAQVQLFQNEAPVGSAIDLFAPERARSEWISLGELSLDAGPANLMFKLVGKHEDATGYGFELARIVCQKTD